jgi:hypothetical protein
MRRVEKNENDDFEDGKCEHDKKIKEKMIKKF